MPLLDKTQGSAPKLSYTEMTKGLSTEVRLRLSHLLGPAPRVVVAKAVKAAVSAPGRAASAAGKAVTKAVKTVASVSNAPPKAKKMPNFDHLNQPRPPASEEALAAMRANSAQAILDAGRRARGLTDAPKVAGTMAFAHLLGGATDDNNEAVSADTAAAIVAAAAVARTATSRKSPAPDTMAAAILAAGRKARGL